MKKEKDVILLPIDFQEQSLIALEYTLYFSRAIDAEIVILHVIEEGNFLTKMFSSDETRKKAKREAEKLLTDVCQKLSEEHTVTTLVECGKVYDKIFEVSERYNPKFIIMGKTEKPSFRRNLLGSNTLHIISESKYPVITVRGSRYITDNDHKNKNIIVPLDLHKEISEQLTTAIEFGRYFESDILIISVLTNRSIKAEIDLMKRLKKARSIVENAGVACCSEIIKEYKKPIHDVVINYAHSQNAHLIVIMTQNELTMVDYFVGSTAQGIINFSDVPVLSIIPWKDNDDSVFNRFVDPFGVFDNV